jgi:hypothetical protein
VTLENPEMVRGARCQGDAGISELTEPFARLLPA